MKQLFTAAALAALVLSAQPAEAATINLAAIPNACLGDDECSLSLGDGNTLDLEALGGDFALKSFNGATGLGVDFWLDDNEIGSLQGIGGAFDQAVQISSFRLYFLYNGPEFGDNQEIAGVLWNNLSGAGSIRATGENTVTLTGFAPGATWSNCSPTTAAGQGCFDIVNPFGTTQITNFLFGPPVLAFGSDFSLGQLETATTVPEPGSMLLLGSGLLGIARAARRRRRQAS